MRDQLWKARRWWHDTLDSLGSPWGSLMLFGGTLILFGIVVMVVPQILVVMVSMALFLAGTGLLTAGWRARQAQKTYRRERVWVRDPFWDW